MLYVTHWLHSILQELQRLVLKILMANPDLQLNLFINMVWMQKVFIRKLKHHYKNICSDLMKILSVGKENILVGWQYFSL